VLAGFQFNQGTFVKINLSAGLLAVSALLAGCETDFDKCMNTEVPNVRSMQTLAFQEIEHDLVALEAIAQRLATWREKSHQAAQRMMDVADDPLFIAAYYGQLAEEKLIEKFPNLVDDSSLVGDFLGFSLNVNLGIFFDEVNEFIEALGVEVSPLWEETSTLLWDTQNPLYETPEGLTPSEESVAEFYLRIPNLLQTMNTRLRLIAVNKNVEVSALEQAIAGAAEKLCNANGIYR
jgi:hypothetical protein